MKQNDVILRSSAREATWRISQTATRVATWHATCGPTSDVTSGAINRAVLSMINNETRAALLDATNDAIRNRTG